MFKLSQKSKDNRIGIDPKLIEISDQAIIITLVDFGHGPHAGLRIAPEQHELYLAGFSEADGYAKLSKHQIQPGEKYSKALDAYAYVDGGASWQHEHLAMVIIAHLQAATMLGYELNCGILWPRIKPKLRNSIEYGWDASHMQLVD